SGPFSDVSGPHAGAINALAARDIIRGKGDGTFDPQGTITRDQVASMLARYLELADASSGPFRDVPASNVHAGAINALAAIGVAQGNDRDEYQPRNDLRRDQAASFVSRALAHTGGGTPPEVPAPDCPDFGAPVPGTATSTTVDGFTPTITVSDTEGLHVGDTITVTGSGFDPASNTGTRPPLAGQPAGVYVVFGNFADAWQPSTGAASSTRAVAHQRWALPGDPDELPFGLGSNPQYVALQSNGTFEVDLVVEEPAATPGGADGYGVFVYAGGGATNANHELEVRTAEPREVVSDDATLTWGVKQSFRNYIVGSIARGSITPAGDVTQAAGNGVFTWDTQLVQAGETGSFETTDGLVTFSGHGGLLHLELSNLVVVTTGETSGILYADVCSRSMDEPVDVAYPDVHLADLTVTEVDGSGERIVVELTAELAADGVDAFAGLYEEGEALDDLTLTFAAPGAP
ncbi:hypothetical protein FTX61_16195, partial [Nitriliruptoraceae bacterium ZYF776]|nr:hypothetical protein [Profundirhabdus halotolerans]